MGRPIPRKEVLLVFDYLAFLNFVDVGELEMGGLIAGAESRRMARLDGRLSVSNFKATFRLCSDSCTAPSKGLLHKRSLKRWVCSVTYEAFKSACHCCEFLVGHLRSNLTVVLVAGHVFRNHSLLDLVLRLVLF